MQHLKKGHTLFWVPLMLLFSLLFISSSALAQNISGEYDVSVRGKNYFLDITPAQKSILDTTTMKISQQGEKISVEFGSFAGAMSATIFKGKVGNNLFSAVWWYQGSPHETKVLWGRVTNNGRQLKGTLMYPRVAYRDEGAPGTPRLVPGWVEVMFTARKKDAPGEIIPGSYITPLKEDCIKFNPRRVNVKQIRGSWKIVQGKMWLLDFGNKKKEALQALRIIRHYRMDKQCFVGRPNPSFEYYLAKNKAPSGSMRGEDCISFNPGNIQVSRVSNSWKVVEGNHWMFDFGPNRSEAEKTLKIIKKYGFTRSCFVGRPDPSFKYLRH